MEGYRRCDLTDARAGMTLQKKTTSLKGYNDYRFQVPIVKALSWNMVILPSGTVNGSTLFTFRLTLQFVKQQKVTHVSVPMHGNFSISISKNQVVKQVVKLVKLLPVERLALLPLTLCYAYHCAFSVSVYCELRWGTMWRGLLLNSHETLMQKKC